LNRMKSLCALFLSMMKIGAFTFGGGYAMIGLLEAEFVSRKRWIDHESFMDLVVIAESTPGPIAINCATYIGYQKGKTAGAVVSTLGMVIPSFTVIFLISLFFDRFLSVAWVASAFRGIQVCVVFLILSAGLRMLKKMKKTVFPICVMSVTFLAMIAFSLLSIGFSSILYILISGCVGLTVYAIGYWKHKKGAPDTEVKK